MHVMNIVTTEVNAVEAPAVPATEVDVVENQTDQSADLDKEGVESTQVTEEVTHQDALDDEGEDDDITNEDDQGNEVEPDTKRKNGFEKALARMKRKQAAETARADFLERKLMELVANQGQPQAAPEPKSEVQENQPPKLEDFESYTDYVEALTTHKAKELIRQELGARDQQAQISSIEAVYRDRLMETKKEIPDLLDVLNSVPRDVPAPDPSVREYVLQSEVGPLIAHKLASNVDVLRKLVAMPPMMQAIEVGKIEAAIIAGRTAKTAKPAPKTTKAPAPATAVEGGSAPKTQTPADVANDYMAWKKMRDEQDRAKGRRR